MEVQVQGGLNCLLRMGIYTKALEVRATYFACDLYDGCHSTSAISVYELSNEVKRRS